ncbi:hypothetical protein AAG570_003061 [Ranatra chinensis]|uniref:Uncharacterized protein n=1 Tax=Ranatra chinensis TaxID=642074 RepID=A0ABD0Y7V7_9HEMI
MELILNSERSPETADDAALLAILQKEDWWGEGQALFTRTGEYILKEENDSATEACEDDPPSSLLDQAGFSLEEALQLVGLNEDTFELPETAAVPARELAVVVEGAKEEVGQETADSPLTDETSLQEDLDLLAEMIHAPNYHHSRSLQCVDPNRFRLIAGMTPAHDRHTSSRYMSYDPNSTSEDGDWSKPVRTNEQGPHPTINYTYSFLLENRIRESFPGPPSFRPSWWVQAMSAWVQGAVRGIDAIVEMHQGASRIIRTSD